MAGRTLLVALVAIFALVAASAPRAADAAPASVSQACSAARPGTATVTIAWANPGAGALQTWVDISLVPGFAWGWFKGHGPFAGNQTVYALDGVPQGLSYFYRVNTLFSNGWRETANGTFYSSCTGGGGGPPATGAVTQTCDGSGNVVATFTWRPGAAGSQWLDLSTYNNGFAPGTFVGAGPVASGGTSFVWYGLGKGMTHYWRVNVLTAAGWISSNTGSFTTLSCMDPVRACIGWIIGYLPAGRAECDIVIAGPDVNLAACVARILGVPGPSNGSCSGVQPAFLRDCLYGKIGQNHFAGTSCRNWWGR